MLKIKQIGMLLVTMSAMLVLFAGCGDKDDGGDKESLATLVAETVSSSTTTNKISTQGPSGITFEATIVSQGGDAEWCSFDLNKQVSSAGGNVGDPAYLYLDKNNSDDDRTARIDVTYTNGYSTSLTLTQRAAGFIDYDRSWGEQPEYRSDDAYIYKTYYATFVSNQFFPGGKLRNYSVCYDVDRHISHWVAYPIFKKVYETPVLSRVNDFNYDPNDQLPVIPTRDQQYIGTGGNGRGYGARGYDRGHMLPQASRYNNYEPNRMTYYGTNMMPQNSTLNQNIWASLEGKVRGWGGLQTYDTLYVVTGAAFKSTKTIDNANGPIAVPSHCWKVLLRQRGNQNRQISQFKADELKAIGFVFTNDDAGAATSIESAVRSVKEIEELMATMKEFAREGKSILFISHKLNEIMEVSDRVSVLRKGKYIGTVNTKDTTKQELSNMMVGRPVQLEVTKDEAKPAGEVLKVDHLCVHSHVQKRNAVNDVSFTVRAGEIVCIAGIDGNGQTELVYGLTGLDKPSSGTITLCGKDISHASIRHRGEHMSHIPEDRHKHGLVLDFTLEQNMVLQRYKEPQFQHGGFIRRDAVREYADRLIEQFDVRSGQGAVTIARSMSGGNQQKAIIAREVDRDKPLIIAVQPTRGLDVGAIEYIHKQLVAQRDAGKAVLLVSLELDEVMSLSDRILVMYEGQIVGELDPKQTTVQELGLYMSGAKRSGKDGESA